MQRRSSIGNTSTDLAEPLDIRKLVNEVADRFEADNKIVVRPGAREELIQPALPHRETVERALQSGEITREFLEESLRTVLKNAMEIAKERGRDAVCEDTTRDSMKRYCPYLFWC